MAGKTKKSTPKKATVASLSKRLDKIESMLQGATRGQSRSESRQRPQRSPQMAQGPSRPNAPSGPAGGGTRPMPRQQGGAGMQSGGMRRPGGMGGMRNA